MALRHNEVPPETLRVPDRQLPAGVAAPIMSNNVHFRDRERVEKGNHISENFIAGIAFGLLRLFCFAIAQHRSEEHTSELQSLMRISYAVFCLKNKINR